MSEQEQQLQELWDEKRKNGTFDSDDFFWQQALEFHDQKREFWERYSYTKKRQEKRSEILSWVVVLFCLGVYAYLAVLVALK